MPVHRDSPGKNTGVGCQDLLQGSFPPQDPTGVSYLVHWQTGSLSLAPRKKRMKILSCILYISFDLFIEVQNSYMIDHSIMPSLIPNVKKNPSFSPPPRHWVASECDARHWAGLPGSHLKRLPQLGVGSFPLSRSTLLRWRRDGTSQSNQCRTWKKKSRESQVRKHSYS